MIYLNFSIEELYILLGFWWNNLKPNYCSSY